MTDWITRTIVLSFFPPLIFYFLYQSEKAIRNHFRSVSKILWDCKTTWAEENKTASQLGQSWLISEERMQCTEQSLSEAKFHISCFGLFEKCIWLPGLFHNENAKENMRFFYNSISLKKVAAVIQMKTLFYCPCSNAVFSIVSSFLRTEYLYNLRRRINRLWVLLKKENLSKLPW